jgi:acyl carrier protein
MTEQADVLGIIKEGMRRANLPDRDIERDTGLYAEGIGFDSLATAELSALLEDEFGTDPFLEADLPQTVGDILDFYERASIG